MLTNIIHVFFPVTFSVDQERIFKWSYEDIKDVLKQRYCLQDVGLEFFSADGNNSLLAFDKTLVRDSVYTSLLSLAPVLSSESIAGVQRDAKVEKVWFDLFVCFFVTFG